MGFGSRYRLQGFKEVGEDDLVQLGCFKIVKNRSAGAKEAKLSRQIVKNRSAGAKEAKLSRQ